MGHEQNISIKQRMKHLSQDGLIYLLFLQNKSWAGLHFNSFQCRNSHGPIWLQFAEKFNVFVGNS